jgi:hypothetical protein
MKGFVASVFLIVVSIGSASAHQKGEHKNSTDCGKGVEHAAKGDAVGAADHVSGCVNELKGGKSKD